MNRLSLGVQSFQPHLLSTLERDHDGSEARRAIEWATSWLPQVSVDLIFGVPGSTLDDWRRDLEEILALDIQHISTYGLTFEKGAPFWSRMSRNELTPVAEELEREMYLLAIESLEAAGWEHYEVSNFARVGARCRHNVKYWQGADYLAFGPGASRHRAGCRETNHRSVTTYIRKMLAGEDVVAEREQLTARQQAHERLVFGLRMLAGVDHHWFAEATGFALHEIGGDAVAHHIRAGRLIDEGGALRLSREGLLVSDSVLVDLIGD